MAVARVQAHMVHPGMGEPMDIVMPNTNLSNNREIGSARGRGRGSASENRSGEMRQSCRRRLRLRIRYRITRNNNNLAPESQYRLVLES